MPEAFTSRLKMPPTEKVSVQFTFLDSPIPTYPKYMEFSPEARVASSGIANDACISRTSYAPQQIFTVMFASTRTCSPTRASGGETVTSGFWSSPYASLSGEIEQRTAVKVRKLRIKALCRFILVIFTW